MKRAQAIRAGVVAWLFLTGGSCLTATGDQAAGQHAALRRSSAPDPDRTAGGRRDEGDLVIFPPGSPQLRQLQTAVVGTAQVFTDEVVAPGRIALDANRVSRVALPLAGRIAQVLVRLGDAVSAGQALLTLESPDADGAVADWRQAQAAVTEARSALVKANADHERAVDLFDHQAIARKEVLAGEHQVAQGQAAVEQAEAALGHALRRLEILGLRPGDGAPRVTVRAPFAGKVIELAATPGEYHNDTSTPVMTIADLSTVWVTSDVPENAIRFIEVGERVQLDLVAYPGEVFDARVTRIADTVDPRTRTIRVQAELANPRGRLRPEMFGRIRHGHGARTLPMVPIEAIVRGSDGGAVFVERGTGRFQRVIVTIDETAREPARNGQVAIINGIKSGDRVVVDGVMLLTGIRER